MVFLPVLIDIDYSRNTIGDVAYLGEVVPLWLLLELWLLLLVLLLSSELLW